MSTSEKFVLSPRNPNRFHPVTMIVLPPIVLAVGLGINVHLHQFKAFHEAIPNLLSNFIIREKIPFAILALQYGMTYFLTAFMTAGTRGVISEEGLDNKYPRRDRANLVGFPARVQAAHENTLENYAGFASAVMVAVLCEVPLDKTIYFTTIYFITRIGFLLSYMSNLDGLRSLLFETANMSLVCLFCFGIVSGFDNYFKWLCGLFLATPF